MQLSPSDSDVADKVMLLKVEKRDMPNANQFRQ